MFMSSLLNVWKFFGKLRKKHPRVQKQTFRQVSKIFKKIFGNLWKSSEKIGECRKVLKTTFHVFLNYFFLKFSEIIGSLRKSSETIGKFSKRSSDNFC